MEVVSKSITANQVLLSNKLLRNVNLFWAGFLVYTLSFALSQSQHVNYIFCELCQLAGLGLLIPTAFLIVRFKFDSQYLQALFVLLCVWSLTIIARGFNFNSDFLKQMLFDAFFGLFLYFVPLIVLFPRALSFYKKVFDVIAVLNIFYILYNIVFIKDLLNDDYSNLVSQSILEQFSKTLSVPNGFILLTFLYHSNKQRILALFVFLLTLFFALYRARRGLVFVCATTLFFSFVLYFRYTKERILTVLLTLVLAAVFLYSIRDSLQSQHGLLSPFTERLDEDTRSSVEAWFYSDLTTKEWIVGKGINGQYYCPYLNEDLSGYRYVIETDYLQMILKGGLISLVLILLILIPAVIQGFFFSKNLLSKAAASWILLWIVYLYPTSVTTFTMHYILVWISVGICYSKKIRNIPEQRMKSYFLTSQNNSLSL